MISSIRAISAHAWDDLDAPDMLDQAIVLPIGNPKDSGVLQEYWGMI